MANVLQILKTERNQMKIVFGRVPEEFMEDGEHFQGVNNKGAKAEFYFKLEMEEEGDGNGTIKIEDTCGRYMPIDFDQLDELVAILNDIQAYRHDRQEFTDYWTKRFGLLGV